jgi:hypothetical protein
MARSPVFPRNLRAVCAALIGGFVIGIVGAFADEASAHGKKGDEGKVEEKIKSSADKYEYKYKDAYCHYEYKYDYRSGKTDVKQQGDCSHIAPFQPVTVSGLRR